MVDRKRKTKLLKQNLRKYLPKRDVTHTEAVNTRYLKNHHVGCALSHRNVILNAKKNDWQSVLVFEEDAVFHRHFKYYFSLVERQIKNIQWDVLYLGACVWNPKPPEPIRTFPNVSGCDNIQILTGSTCTHAIAYNNTVYDYLLENIPTSRKELHTSEYAIDQWIMSNMQIKSSPWKCYMTFPRIVTQPFLIAPEGDLNSYKQDSGKDFPYEF